MKLAQGEYVALEKIENAYSASTIIAQLYVHGDSLQDHLLGIVVPDPIQLAAISSNLNGTKVTAEDIGALVTASKDPRVVEAIMHAMAKEAKKTGLKGCTSSSAFDWIGG